MSDPLIRTVIFVHVARRWLTFHRRHMLLALAEALPSSIALVCVDRPITPDVTLWKDPARFWTRPWRMVEEGDGDLIRVVKLRLAAHDITAERIPVLKPVNRWLARGQLRRFLHARFPDAVQVIQWIYHPMQRWLFDVWPDVGRVYECYDEYCCTPAGQWVVSRWRREESVLERADLTFVTSQPLLAARTDMAHRIVHVPNGVPEFFFQVGGTIPDPIEAIPHPRVIYLGNLRSPVDVPLLTEVFQCHPRWQFVHLGPVDRSLDLRTLRRMGNAHFLGPCLYEQVPDLLRHCDVGLIPFRLNAFSLALNPLKTWEYLACGLPVVASNLPELKILGDLVYIAANDAAIFGQAIETALAADAPGHARHAIAAAHGFSWSAIVRRCVLPQLTDAFGI